MGFGDNDKFTARFVLEYLNRFETENAIEIITEIHLSNNGYKVSEYLLDKEFVNLFLLIGDSKQVLSYLRFAKFVFNLEADEFYRYWFLFSSAKLFCAYGDVIKNYFQVHILLLSNLYITISMSHIKLSEEIIFDSSFYITEALKKSNYTDIFDILDKKRIYFETVNNNELEKDRIVKLQKKENITAISMLDALNKFAEENDEEIIDDIYINDPYYEIEEYKQDQEVVKLFLTEGDPKMISNYLEFAKIIETTDLDTVSKYLLFLSSAKLFYAYGGIIENYLPTHKLLLSEVYMYTYIDRMFISEEVITDSSFYIREVRNNKSYEEMFYILNKRHDDLEAVYDGKMEDKKKIYH